MTSSYLLLADIEVERDPKRAIVFLNEGWDIAKKASLDRLAIYFPLILGLAHLKLGNADRAEHGFTEGLQAAHEVGQLPQASANLIGRAEALLLKNEIIAAADDLKQGIRLALKTGSGRYLMWAAVISCRVSARRLATPTAKELLLTTLRHPAADQDARDKAADTLSEFFEISAGSELDPVDDVPSLDEIAELSLQLLTVD